MKWAWSIGLGLLLAVAAWGQSEFPSDDLSLRELTGVRITQGDYGFVTRARIEITSWTIPELAAEIDSALKQVEFYYEGIYLVVPNCQDADTSQVTEVVGRFTPWQLSRISPTGPWQWDGPLVVQLADSTACPMFSNLRERRWSAIVIGDNNESRRQAHRELQDLIRRYKRERVERMEEMFRK